MRLSRYRLIAAVVAIAAVIAAVMYQTSAERRAESPAGAGILKTELIVAAASSLKSGFDEIVSDYEARHAGVTVTVTYGSSGALKQQIEQGAPADLFVFADTKQSDELAAAGLADEVTVLLGNRLTLVVPAGAADAPAKLEDLANARVERIAVGQPDTVPAGRYALETLQSAGLLASVQSKLVPAKDVRQVLTYVESGNADAGFVYRSDALGSDKVKIVQDIPESLHGAIRYPAGIVSASKHRVEAERLLAYLESDRALLTFKSHGFEPAAR